MMPKVKLTQTTETINKTKGKQVNTYALSHRIQGILVPHLVQAETKIYQILHKVDLTPIMSEIKGNKGIHTG